MQPIQASQFENLFEERLQAYDVDRKMVDQEQREQDEVTGRLQEAQRAFEQARRGHSSSRERERALQELENGFLKYKELLTNLDVGRTFYNDLAKIVGRFRDDCKGFVQQRRVEACQLEK
jgi:programmed cell death 6-interacting protein